MHFYYIFDKPLLYTDDKIWNEFNKQLNIGLSFSRKNSVKELWQRMTFILDNTHKHGESDYSWESEERELGRMIDLLLK